MAIRSFAVVAGAEGAAVYFSAVPRILRRPNDIGLAEGDGSFDGLAVVAFFGLGEAAAVKHGGMRLAFA